MLIRLQKNHLLALLLGAAVLLGYSHQLTGQILAHHHCAEHSSHDHCGHDHGDHHHDHSSSDEKSPESSSSDDSCHCDSCHFVSATTDLPTPFSFLTSVTAFEAALNEPVPDSPVPALDLPPIILAA